jgi:hypothetical protein
LPVLVARYPQMIDFPAHMARRHAGPWAKPLPARYYSEWKWTGNLGVDILIRPFAALFGLELGSKIIVALVPPLTGIGIVWVEWALRRRIGFGTLLGLSFIWSPMLLLGLVNYALGQALALIAFAIWVQMGPRGVWQRAMDWRWVMLIVAGLVVWVSHISAWAVLIVLVGGADFSRRLGEGWRRWWRAAVAPIPLFTPVIVMVLLRHLQRDQLWSLLVDLQEVHLGTRHARHQLDAGPCVDLGGGGGHRPGHRVDGAVLCAQMARRLAVPGRAQLVRRASGLAGAVPGHPELGRAAPYFGRRSGRLPPDHDGGDGLRHGHRLGAAVVGAVHAGGALSGASGHDHDELAAGFGGNGRDPESTGLCARWGEDRQRGADPA